ncbi:hypothetical protein AAFF_G00191000 [Aldrovandia affinis]|uniref:Uncharacterized protein n=1 Tax=Aldrovandia affinis TaxID=143900 RepID=A0AAD7RIZ3_9TELE|nr:hypothetical protein AAFF_G00191000 [Aldrovandia affinis]
MTKKERDHQKGSVIVRIFPGRLRWGEQMNSVSLRYGSCVVRRQREDPGKSHGRRTRWAMKEPGRGTSACGALNRDDRVTRQSQKSSGKSTGPQQARSLLAGAGRARSNACR